MVAHAVKIYNCPACPGVHFLCAGDEVVMAGEGWPLGPADGLVLRANQAMRPGG